MHVFDLPEDLLKHLILYLPWRDLIRYKLTCNMLWWWIDKNFLIMDKAVRSKWGFKLMKYEHITISDGSSDITKLKTILSRNIHRPINSRWMEIKECGHRLFVMNYVLGEEMKVWSPIIPTHLFTATSEHWIAMCRCAQASKWSDRDFNAVSDGHNTLARMIQDITTMVRDKAANVCSVVVVGSPYKQWDTTPPTPLRALKAVKIYAKRNEATGTYGRNGFKRQKIGRGIHIPTEYVDRINKTTSKSFHALQSMKLNKGKECRIRIGFSVYVNPAKRWEWYIRCVFDRIRIYVS
jgi:hypothetical protein